MSNTRRSPAPEPPPGAVLRTPVYVCSRGHQTRWSGGDRVTFCPFLIARNTRCGAVARVEEVPMAL